MSNAAIHIFESLSGWMTKETFEHTHEGYIENSGPLPIFWTAQPDGHYPQPLRATWLAGNFFYKPL